MLEDLKVRDVMTAGNVITVPPSEDVVFAFEKLMKHKISSLPVVFEDKLVGIVTATDLGHNLILDKYELGTSVEKVMVKDVAVIGPDEDLIKAVKKMRSSSDGIINQLVVMEGNKMTGIISDGDIIKALKF
ncbi:MAG: CBS domain-containing protein [Methanobacteriaceae archaeon]|jgi:CBS domain-containing protein|nr:CBS domain-containing protein [Methanobacteriaceae archaeon]OPY19802.1 MAG: Methylated protein [Methanobacterium sp. PtaU1.Bin097]